MQHHTGRGDDASRRGNPSPVRRLCQSPEDERDQGRTGRVLLFRVVLCNRQQRRKGWRVKDGQGLVCFLIGKIVTVVDNDGVRMQLQGGTFIWSTDLHLKTVDLFF